MPLVLSTSVFQEAGLPLLSEKSPSAPSSQCLNSQALLRPEPGLLESHCPEASQGPMRRNFADPPPDLAHLTSPLTLPTRLQDTSQTTAAGMDPKEPCRHDVNSICAGSKEQRLQPVALTSPEQVLRSGPEDPRINCQPRGGLGSSDGLQPGPPPPPC